MKNLILTLILCLLGTMTTACSSMQTDYSMLVSVDDRYIDTADRIVLQYALNVDPRWTNLNDYTENTTHVLSAKTICTTEQSIWIPDKLVKDCQKYLVMTDAKTSRVLFQAAGTETANHSDTLDWQDALEALYDKYDDYVRE